MKESYTQRINRILKENSGTYQSLERKEGRNPYDLNTEWVGCRIKGSKERRDEERDKKFKEIIERFYEKFTLNDGFFGRDKKNIQNYLLTCVWGYYQQGKKLENWDDKKKKSFKKSQRTPNLIGENIDITILAIIYSYFCEMLFYCQDSVIKLIHSISGENYNRLENVIGEISLILNKIENDVRFPKANKRMHFYYQKEFSKKYYNLQKVDCLFMKSDYEGFEKLFIYNKKQMKQNKILKNMSQEMINKCVLEYSKDRSLDSKKVVMLILNELDKKDKPRKCLTGACCYVLSHYYSKLHTFYIYPKKSISAWARFYGVDRTKFKQRVEEVFEHIEIIRNYLLKESVERINLLFRNC